MSQHLTGAAVARRLFDSYVFEGALQHEAMASRGTVAVTRMRLGNRGTFVALADGRWTMLPGRERIGFVSFDDPELVEIVHELVPLGLLTPSEYMTLHDWYRKRRAAARQRRDLKELEAIEARVGLLRRRIHESLR